jgi:hypothetical protein
MYFSDIVGTLFKIYTKPVDVCDYSDGFLLYRFYNEPDYQDLRKWGFDFEVKSCDVDDVDDVIRVYVINN